MAVALLATTSVALAKTNKLTGHLKNQKDGEITIKVKLNKKGVVKKVTAINVSNFKTYCSDRNFNRIPNKTVSAKLGAFKVNKSSCDGGGRFSVKKKQGGKPSGPAC